MPSSVQPGGAGPSARHRRAEPGSRSAGVAPRSTDGPRGRPRNQIERIRSHTGSMDMYDRPSPAARGDALLRLRTVTTGVAIAGIAGIAGFGIAAASGYRGTSTAGHTSGANATPVPFQQQQVIPNDDGFTAPAPN